MIKTVSATEVKNNFGAWLKHVYQTNDHLIIEKGGIPVAVVVPIADYQEYLSHSGQQTADAQDQIARASQLSQSIHKLQDTLARQSGKKPKSAVPGETQTTPEKEETRK